MTYLIELLRGLNEKTHVMCEGGTHTQVRLLMRQDLTLCVTFRGDQEGEEH